MSPEFALRLPHPDPGKWAAGALAVLVHALLASLLIFGVQWQTQPRETAVQVELYRAEPAPAPAAVRPPPPHPEAAVRPPEPRPMPKVVPRPEPKVEARPAPLKPDIAIKEKLPPKVEPKVQAKPEPKPVPKHEAKLATKTPPKVAGPDWSKELASTEQNLASTKASQDAARELQGMKAAQASAARSKASKDWGDRIAAKVKGNIVVPPGVSGNPQAEFDISLLPDGSVLAAKLRKSSGNQALDAAIERAIHKSSPLPLPDDKSVFQRELRSIFRPLEN